jgi:signal transduction histidine kinase
MTARSAQHHAEGGFMSKKSSSVRGYGGCAESFCIFVLRFWLILEIGMFLASNKAFGETPDEVNSSEPTITNALQLRRLASQESPASYSISIEGTVLWISQARDQLILQDGSGGVAISADFSNQPSVAFGEKILIKASCLVGRGEITCTPLVNNDGTHSLSEAAGTVFLSKGFYPIRVEWFNALGQFGLNVDWEAPGNTRSKIPDNVLFHAETDLINDTNRFTPGLKFNCYEGKWGRLPDFTTLPVLKTGIVSNFDLGVRTRSDKVGLVFDGYIRMPTDGSYAFWTKSDDGSKLFIGSQFLQLKPLGMPEPVRPNRIVSGQYIQEEHRFQWTEVEGMVTFISDLSGSVRLELNSDTGRTDLEFINASADSLRYLLGCRIRATGICETALSTDEQPGFYLFVPNLKNIEITEMAPEDWADYPTVSINSLKEAGLRESGDTMIHISGTVCSNMPGNLMMIKDKTGQLMVKTEQSLPQTGDEIEILGGWDGSDNGAVLKSDFYRRIAPEKRTGSTSLPVLTEAEQVKRLDRTEAQRGYPTKIRGVITAQIGGGFAIQDSTWSVFFKFKSLFEAMPKVGESWTIEGNTTMDFAPSIQVTNAIYLGAGILPEPIRPTWDELINGSLDTQYIEIQGVVTEVEADNLMLLTRDGELSLELPDLAPERFVGLKGAVIRIRGVSSPARDENLETIVAHLRLFNASITIDAPPPALPFEIKMKRVSDLLLFDPRANALRRVRIAGQIVHENKGEYFLMDGTNGLRFYPEKPIKLHEGDLVEVVGFPDMNGPSPVLREAIVRQTGKKGLPMAHRISADAILSAKLDATLVRVDARVVSCNLDPSELVLDLQSGNRAFVARLNTGTGILPNVLPDSQVELTGVYAGQGRDRILNQNVDSFELLLNSPSDIRILERPSWWTVRHTLIVLSVMIFSILGSLIWITLLRVQVEDRSQRLATEVQRREHTEHQRVLQEERTRIAQDLHDDLGATLTQIRFLSAIQSSGSSVPEATRTQLKQISEKSRQMVASLDEIVWAINPANDSLRSLASYLRHTAEEFFKTSNISCRLDIDKSLPVLPLTSEMRHNLCLAVKEALNNSAKHSRATEIWLRIHWHDQSLIITIEDNGCGIADVRQSDGRNGLINMRQRLDKIGGRFVYYASPNTGTICRISLPFS